MKRPTLEELTAYIATRETKIDPEAFMDHYEANGWKVGKVTMVNWQAAVRTWERKQPGYMPKLQVKVVGRSIFFYEESRPDRSIGDRGLALARARLKS